MPKSSNRSFWPLAFVGLVLVTIVGIYIAARPAAKTAGALPPTKHTTSIAQDSPPPLPPVVTKAPEPGPTPPPPGNQTKPKKGARLTIKAGQPIPELFPFQAERERLSDLGATYDAHNIPVIAASLKHADATVRDAARHALVQIGDAAAIPYLKEAAAAAKTPEEAETLASSAEFLSLPSFMDVITANNSGATLVH